MSLSIDIYNDLFTSPNPYDSTSSAHETSLYLTSCLDLTKGLIIHFDDAAELSHDLMAEAVPTYDNNAPKRVWRYYRNMAGIYTEIDPPMFIQSLDTFEEIPFTVESLQAHAATRTALIRDTDIRELFMDKYPDNEVLIAGIINPIPISVSTEAKNGEILYYPPHLVQFNEYSFIEDLNTWISNHMDRWYNAQYLHADELYVAAYYGTLYPAMYNAILGLREDRIHTLEVHSFHVQQYLASHGLLDRYIDILTHGQRLWLYRNIRYVKKYAGHDYTFQLLITNLLDPAHIPLDGHNMSLVHQTIGIAPVFTTNGYSAIRSLGLRPNDLEQYRDLEKRAVSGGVGPYTLTGVDHYSARHPVSIQTQRNKIRHSRLGKVRTKMLESTTTDYDTDSLYSELDVLHDHWLHYASTGSYTASISIVDLAINDRVTVSMTDAYVLMRIMFSEITDTPLTIRDPEMVQVLESINYSDYVGDTDPVALKQAVDYVNYNLHSISEYRSIAAFNTNVSLIHEGLNNILRYRSSHTDINIQSAMTAMIHDIYKSPSSPIDVDNWRERTGITVNPPLLEDKISLFTSIIAESTGYVVDKTLREVQEGMVDYMKQLTSYGVSYNYNTVRVPVKYLHSATSHILRTINYVVSSLYADLSNNRLLLSDTMVNAASIDMPHSLHAVDTFTYSIHNNIDMWSVEHSTVHIHTPNITLSE